MYVVCPFCSITLQAYVPFSAVTIEIVFKLEEVPDTSTEMTLYENGDIGGSSGSIGYFITIDPGLMVKVADWRSRLAR